MGAHQTTQGGRRGGGGGGGGALTEALACDKSDLDDLLGLSAMPAWAEFFEWDATSNLWREKYPELSLRWAYETLKAGWYGKDPANEVPKILWDENEDILPGHKDYVPMTDAETMEHTANSGQVGAFAHVPASCA